VLTPISKTLNLRLSILNFPFRIYNIDKSFEVRGGINKKFNFCPHYIFEIFGEVIKPRDSDFSKIGNLAGFGIFYKGLFYMKAIYIESQKNLDFQNFGLEIGIKHNFIQLKGNEN